MMSKELVLTKAQDIVKHSIQTRLWEDILPSKEFYLYSAPIFTLLTAALVMMLCAGFNKEPTKPNRFSFFFAVFSLLISSFFSCFIKIKSATAYIGSGFLADSLTQSSFLVISLGALFTFICASSTEVGRRLLRPEMTALMFMATSGLMIMCSAGEFLSFFVGLELMSLSIYVIVGYQRQDLSALEAAIKYFILGAALSAVMLMGAALVYASVGSLRFYDFAHINLLNPFAFFGLFFIFTGLAFKLAVAPFHSWAPDVYQGANAHLSGYMSSLVKFSVVIVFIRIICSLNLQTVPVGFVHFFSALAVVSIVIGSLFGLVQSSVKRILAYSSVANAGYFCLGFAALIQNPNNIIAKQALFAYAVIYAILSIGAFNVVAYFEDHNREDLLREELAGLGARKPAAAIALSVFMFGLAGIPPLAGFFGKFLLLLSVVGTSLTWLAIVLIVFSAFSLYYYLNILVDIWFKPSSRYSASKFSTNHSFRHRITFFCVTLAVISIILGIVGPRFAFKIDFTQGYEKNRRIISPERDHVPDLTTFLELNEHEKLSTIR